MNLTALSRTVVKPNYALLTPESRVPSEVPGWVNAKVFVQISEALGAGFCQMLVDTQSNFKETGQTEISQVFIYVLHGAGEGNAGGTHKHMGQGHFLYVPAGARYELSSFEPGSQLLIFQKAYKPLKGQSAPAALFGDSGVIAASAFMDDEALQLQALLPNHPAFDMAVNIFTYHPGGHLPFVETHIMEHGLMFLKGQGIYMLDHDWYPVRKDDSIWMGPYCRQWFTVVGKERAVYIYYKDVNRLPAKE